LKEESRGDGGNGNDIGVERRKKSKLLSLIEKKDGNTWSDQKETVEC
jgi:hypothetical protein